MGMSKETEQNIQQLQLIEQNLQNFLVQKQNFQLQLMEVESAFDELDKTDTAYKIVGNIMIHADKDKLKEELSSKKETLYLRLKSIEKQESKIREKATKLQQEVLENLNSASPQE